MVHAAQDEHPQLFSVDLRPAVEHRNEVSRYKLGSHGIVCLGNDGTVLWKHSGHEIAQQTLDAGVQKVLAALESAP